LTNKYLQTADNAYIADIFYTDKQNISVKNSAQPFAAITLEVN
jgi:hypothetical protein